MMFSTAATAQRIGYGAFPFVDLMVDFRALGPDGSPALPQSKVELMGVLPNGVTMSASFPLE